MLRRYDGTKAYENVFEVPIFSVFLNGHYYFFSDTFAMLSHVNRKMSCPHKSNRHHKVVMTLREGACLQYGLKALSHFGMWDGQFSQLSNCGNDPIVQGVLCKA